MKKVPSLRGDKLARARACVREREREEERRKAIVEVVNVARGRCRSRHASSSFRDRDRDCAQLQRVATIERPRESSDKFGDDRARILFAGSIESRKMRTKADYPRVYPTTTTSAD